MGKQRRSKKRSKRAPKDERKQSESLSGPAIVQRIRHGDARVRHAAITAISGNTKIHPSCLQAVRDCLLDKDLECAVAASECLTLYLQNADPDKLDHQSTAGRLVVLAGRLRECGLRSSDASIDSASCIQWFKLASRCIQCIVVLLEVNDVAMGRLVPTDYRTSELRSEVFSTVNTCFAEQKDAQRAGSMTERWGNERRKHAGARFGIVTFCLACEVM